MSKEFVYIDGKGDMALLKKLKLGIREMHSFWAKSKSKAGVRFVKVLSHPSKWSIGLGVLGKDRLNGE